MKIIIVGHRIAVHLAQGLAYSKGSINVLLTTIIHVFVHYCILSTSNSIWHTAITQ